MKHRFGIVVSRFNSEITGALLDSCLATLRKHGARDADIRTVWVPGGYEIPWAAQELALTKRFDAIICLGCVLKGETPQNEHIAASTIHHLHTVSLSTRVPCILGVITPNTWAQAKARTKGALDRGRESAEAAVALLRETSWVRKRR